MKTIITTIIALFTCINSFATTWYVNNSTGSNANTGTTAGSPFQTITHAISVAAASGDDIIVAAGTYAEGPVMISKSIVLTGPNTGINGSDTRVTEAVITRSSGSSTGSVIGISTNNITIDGFKLDGNVISSGSGIATWSTDANTSTYVNVNGIQVLNNIITGMQNNGIVLDNSGIPAATASNNVSNNLVINIVNAPAAFATTSGSYVSTGFAVSMRNSCYADVTNNTISNCYGGVFAKSMGGTGLSGSSLIASNSISVNSYTDVCGSNLIRFGTGIFLFAIDNGAAITADDNTITRYSASGYIIGFTIVNVSAGASVALTGNYITKALYGVNASGCYGSGVNAVSISGGAIGGASGVTTDACYVGINLTNNYIANLVACVSPTFIAASAATYFVIDGVTINNSQKYAVMSDGTGNLGQITDVTIKNCLIDKTQNIDAVSDNAALYFLGAGGSNVTATVTANTISNSLNRGINIFGCGNMSINQNTFSENANFDLILRKKTNNTTVNFANNSIIRIISTTQSIWRDYSGGTAGLGLNITFNCNDNSFVTNDLVINTVSAGTGNTDASRNYYGTTTATGVAGKIFAGAVPIDITPWLESGIDADLITPGFQPDYTTLHVTASNSQFAASGRIAEAQALSGNSVVNVWTGTYSDIDAISVGTGKSLIINGGNVTQNSNFTVSGTIDLSAYALITTGTFTLNANSTLITANVNGITSVGPTGAVQATIRNFNGTGGHNSGNFIFNSTSTQTCGAGVPAIVNNLTVNNPLGVTLSNNTQVNGDLDITNGPINTGTGNTLTLNGTLTGGSSISGTTLTLNSASISYYPGGVLTNLNITQNTTLTNTSTVLGTLALSTHTLTLDTSTLTVGNVAISGGTITGTGTINGSGTGKLRIFGFGADLALQLPTISNGLQRLTINRPNGAVLPADLEVSDLLDLQEGPLDANGFTLYITNSAPASVDYGTTGRLINGYLKRDVTSAQLYSFPVGSSGAQQLLALNMSGTSGGLTNIKVAFNGTNPLLNPLPSALVPFNEQGGVFTTMLTSGWWEVTPDAGSATYEMDMYPSFMSSNAAYSIVKRDSPLGITWYQNGSISNPEGTSTGIQSDGSIRRTGMSGFSNFAVAGSLLSPLPVTLLSFSGRQVNSGTMLSWVTAQEINSKEYLVERSADGITYQPVGKVAAAGFNNEQSVYNLSDTYKWSNETDKQYYRLTEFDLNGKSETFAPIVVNAKGINGIHAGVYPNPGRDFITFSFGNSKTAEMIMYNSAGQIVQQSRIYSGQPINTSSLVPGVYAVNLSTEDGLAENLRILLDR
ncbi:MAG: T9SS type A sorting domain-containing protein [Bacteroidota bacterium]